MYRLTLGIALMCSWVACNSDTPENIELQSLRVSAVKQIDTVYSNEFIADIHSKQKIEIRSKVHGFLEGISVDEGQFVTKGQILFRISNKEYAQEVLLAKAALKAARAEKKAANLEINNLRTLRTREIISEAELQKALIHLESAEARLEEAELRLQTAEINQSLTIIKAPFEGVINRIPLKMGSLIDEGTLLTTLSNNAEVYAYFHMPEKDYLSLKTANRVTPKVSLNLLLADNSPHKYAGFLETEDSEFDRSMGNISFRAKFPNPELLLKHGSTGKVQWIVPLKQAWVIPQSACFEIQDKYYVYTIAPDSILKAHPLKVKQRLPHLFVIEPNFKSSDRILLEGIQSVKAGEKIKPIGAVGGDGLNLTQR
jgi:membrane fusion protein (multidrug efflux system)